MIPKQATTASDLVRSASPDATEVSLRAVTKRLRDGKPWLEVDHPYNKNVVKALGQKGIDAETLGEYIASSTLLHLADGWNYLSRAFDAASRGDRSAAYHLAYYAELRAAISLLATEGIGVFNDRHVALNSHLKPTLLKGVGTHRATWEILSAWSQEKGKAARLLEAITIESKSLSDWLKEVGVFQPAQELLAKEWLQAWSLDLKVLSTDPRRRNELSYQPTRIRTPSPTSVDPDREIVDPILHSWAELEPSFDGTGAALDLSLFRRSLALVVRSGLCNHRSFAAVLGSLEGALTDPTYRALKFGSASADAIFDNAKVKNDQRGVATPILARGLLMLRLAAASTAVLLKAAGISKSDLEFWWSPLGTDLGLWGAPDDIETFSDLWNDVDEAKRELIRTYQPSRVAGPFKWSPVSSPSTCP